MSLLPCTYVLCVWAHTCVGTYTMDHVSGVRDSLQELLSSFATCVQLVSCQLSSWGQMGRGNLNREPVSVRLAYRQVCRVFSRFLTDWEGWPLGAMPLLGKWPWAAEAAKQCSSMVADSVLRWAVRWTHTHPKAALGYGVYHGSKKQTRPTWLPGTELRSSGLAASALTHGASHCPHTQCLT